MHTTSSCGDWAKVAVGISPSPQSLITVSRVLARMCTLLSGTRCSTCSGPVKSSWVTLGNSTKPMLSGMTGPPTLSVGLAALVGGTFERLALGGAGDVEALEVAVALVELVAHPDEEVVEGVAAEAQGQALDRFQLSAPFALEARQVVLEEDDGGGEDHAPALGQRPLGQHGAVEVGDVARPPEVE